MVKHEFVVGDQEKHTITVYHSYLTGGVEIQVDGTRIADALQWVSTKEWEFDIGVVERHRLRLKVHGLLFSHVDATLDGAVVYQQ